MDKIYRAGLVPFIIEDDNISMMFMTPADPNYGGNNPQIAKGKIDPGENAKQAAVREASEELGLFKPNIDGKIYHLGRFLGRTDVYFCKIKDKEQFGDPHYETGKVSWLSPEEFDDQGRSLHKPVINAVVRSIKKKENLK